MQKMVKLNQGNLKVRTVNKLEGIIKRRKERTVGYKPDIIIEPRGHKELCSIC